jgi:hypothetical protein
MLSTILKMEEVAGNWRKLHAGKGKFYDLYPSPALIIGVIK